MALLTGTKLGPYEIVAPLGAGGMGEGYRARDTRLGREVAIKVLPTHLAENSEAKQRLGTPKLLFRANIAPMGSGYDVAQDGQSVVVQVNAKGSQAPLNFVTNWMTELKK